MRVFAKNATWKPVVIATFESLGVFLYETGNRFFHGCSVAQLHSFVSLQNPYEDARITKLLQRACSARFSRPYTVESTTIEHAIGKNFVIHHRKCVQRRKPCRKPIPHTPENTMQHMNRHQSALNRATLLKSPENRMIPLIDAWLNNPDFQLCVTCNSNFLCFSPTDGGGRR